MEKNIILGPPGTGKTYELLNIIKELLKDYKPNEIAYVTFTKEGAEQGKKRSLEKFKGSIYQEDLKYFSTLHSLAFRQLNLDRNQVLNWKHYKIFSKKVGMNFCGYYTEDLTNNDDKYLFFNELYRNNPECAKLYLDYLDISKVEYVNKSFNNFKKTFELIDYTDMIEKFIKRNKSVGVKICIIDEAQDLTSLQWKMIWVAFKDCEKMYIAGDDDQAIYQWSGADVNYFLGLKGNVKILNKSYRLPDNILNFSTYITKQIQNRVDKEYVGRGKNGKLDLISQINELNLKNNETWMILSRNNFYLREIRDYLMNNGLLFFDKKKPSAIDKDFELIKLFERLRKTNIISNNESYKLKECTDKINLKVPWYNNFNWKPEKIAYFRNIIENKNYNFKDIKIKLGTIHSVKGGEADNVILLSDITKNVKDNFDKNPDSEHRVFYVGATRAKKNLYIREGKSKGEYEFNKRSFI